MSLVMDVVFGNNWAMYSHLMVARAKIDVREVLGTVQPVQ